MHGESPASGHRAFDRRKRLQGGFGKGIVFTTDLALEESERLLQETGREIPGVTMAEEKTDWAIITRVEVLNEEGERALGKKRGRYVTVESPELARRNRVAEESVSSVLAKEISSMANLVPEASVLVVGLGNWNATPDALGPRVVSKLLVTRHLAGAVPPELLGDLRPVAAISPGVLGLTGIETSEIVRGVVERVKPDMVIAIDALCARNLGRLITTIQVSDTGIHPGSGIGNKRAGLTSEILGCPVMAVGCPTVVQATTIAADTVDILTEQLAGEAKFYEILRQMKKDEKDELIREVLSPSVGNLVVTPKEIDAYIEEISRVISGALNAAFHPKISREEISLYVS